MLKARSKYTAPFPHNKGKGLGWGYILLIFLVFLITPTQAQTLTGRITTHEGKPLPNALVGVEGRPVQEPTRADGKFSLKVSAFPVRVIAYAEGFQIADTLVPNESFLAISLQPLATSLAGITVEAQREKAFGVSRLRPVEDFGLYEAKKSEVIRPADLAANTATNNPRQVFNRVPGLNIWESDGAGLQLGIGGRGLSPNRTSNFNTRQNGYDIAADALGYPESYYTPPTEAVERIEMTRGAAALQYGTQFGGMLNFRMRKGEEAPFNLQLRQTGGSWGFSNSFVSVNGTSAGGRFNYFTFYQYKQAVGWRPFSRFKYDMAFAGLEWRQGRWKLRIDYTFMHYLARQPGGLTDKNFADGPRQALRKRNWFQVRWNLPAFTAEYAISERTAVTTRVFGLVARRQALGKLDRINVADLGGDRDLIDGQFQNIGMETRLLHRISLLGRPALALVGMRLYRGHAMSRQGLASAGDGPDFTFNRPDSLESGDFTFPSFNAAGFAELILPISERINLVPGIRYERIYTGSSGYYRQRILDFAGNVISDIEMPDNRTLGRNVVLLAMGASYKPHSGASEAYANISQNYRAVNFNDIRVNNPNIRIDPNIRDEKGFSADLGWRSTTLGSLLSWDMSVFYLRYNNRIGLLLQEDTVLFQDYRYRTNVARATNIGFEGYSELSLTRLLEAFRGQTGLRREARNYNLSLFGNLAVIDARYGPGRDSTVEGKEVELVPPFTVRGGLSGYWGRFKASVSGNYVDRQYSDASNARRAASAVNGIIPAYYVFDATASCRLPWGFMVEASVNNLFSQRYFTRRADSYPGPGIIPSDPRAFYLTVEWKIAAKN